MKKDDVYMCLHVASIKTTAGNKTRFFPGPLLISTSWFLILAKAFGNGLVVACSTARRSATAKNERNSYVTDPCLSKMTRRSSTADWIKFY